jgi:hypothetical protein
MKLQKRTGSLREKVGRLRSQARTVVRRIPSVQSWPGWAHHTVQAACFMAGIGAVLVWLYSWPLAVFVALFCVGMYVFLR